MNTRFTGAIRPLTARVNVPRIFTRISAVATLLTQLGTPHVEAGDFIFDNGGVTIGDAVTTNVLWSTPNIWNPDAASPTALLDNMIFNATAMPTTANANTVLNLDLESNSLSLNGILNMGGSGTNPNNVTINLVSTGLANVSLTQIIKSGGGTFQIAPSVPVTVLANPVNNPSGNLHVVNTDDSQIQLQSLLTVAGDVVKHGTGGGLLRFGTSGSTFENAISGNIIVNGGSVEFATNSSNTAGGTGRAIVMNSPAGVLNFRTQSNVDFVREIDLGAYFTTLSADRSAGTSTGLTVSTGTINVLRNDNYLQLNSGNAFGWAFDGINIGTRTFNIRNGLNGGAKALVGALTGSGTIHVSGNGDNNTAGLNFNAPSPNFSGIVRFYESAGNLITATGALGSGTIILGTDQTFAPVTLPNPSLGSSTPTVRNQPWSALLNYNANNPTTGPVAVTAYAGSQVNMGVIPTATDVVELKPYGILQGESAELAGFAVGTNLILPAENAIIAHEALGGGDPFGLPAEPRHFFGISAPATLAGAFTVGAGTPWKGLSNDRFARNIGGAGTSITVNGGDTNPDTIEATFLGVYGKTFQLFAGGGTWLSGNGQPVTIEIAGATNNFGNLSATANLGGTVYFMSSAAASGLSPTVVDKIRVAANLQAQGANMFGGVPVEVVAGGGVDPGNANTFDTNVVFRSGGKLLHNDNMVFTGTGTLTFESGSHFYIVGNAPANTLTSSPQSLTFGGNNYHIRFGSNVAANQNIQEMDLRIPDAGAVWEIAGGINTTHSGVVNNNDVPTSTQLEGISTDGGIITNDTGSKAFIGPITIGNTGATFAATTNTRLILIDPVVAGTDSGAGAAPIKIGSLTPINHIGKTANEVAVNNNFATLNAYNGTTGILFTQGLKSGPINVLASDLYLDGPADKTKITGDIVMGSNSRLYLGDGGDIATGNAFDTALLPRRGDLTPLLVSSAPDGNVTTGAQGIVFGNYSRIEMGLDFTDPAFAASSVNGFGQINQPFVIPDNTELNPQDRRSFWVNRVGGAAAPVEFNSITVGNNANIAFQENALDVRATLRLTGATAIASPGNGSAWDLKNVVNVGGGAKTLQLGRTDQPFTETSLYGTVDAAISIKNVRARLAIRDSSVIPADFVFNDDADSRVVFNLHGTTPAGTNNGTDHTLSIVKGSTGDPFTFLTTGTFNMNKPNAWGGYVQDGSIVPLRNEIGAGIAIKTGGGTIFADRDGADTSVNGTVHFSVVSLDAPDLTLATRNLVDLEVGTLGISQNAVIRVDGAQADGFGSGTGAVRIRDVVAGTRNVHFQNGRTTITGNVTAGTLTAGGVNLEFNAEGASRVHEVANIQVNSLLTTTNGTTDFGDTKIRSSAPGTLIAGLREGRIAGTAINTTTVNPGSDPNTANQLNSNNLGIRLDPRLGQNNYTSGAAADSARGWSDNQTFVYTGQVFDADGIFTFAEQIDDSVEIKIDGVRVLFSRNTSGAVGGTGLVPQAPFEPWRTVTNTSTRDGLSEGYRQPISGLGDIGSGLGDLTVHNVNEFGGTQSFGMGTGNDGWHDIEIRMHNGTGGGGPVAALGWGNYFGLGMNSGATTSFVGTDYTKPMDNGSMNLFRTTVVARGNVNIEGGSVLLAGGFDGIGAIAYSEVGIGVARINDTGVNYASTADGIVLFPGATGELGIDRAGDSLTAGLYRGDGSFTKSGPGTLVITGATNIAPGTTFSVAEGRAELNGPGTGSGALSVTGASAVASVNGSIAGSATVENGALLEGNGSIAGEVTVLAGRIGAGNNGTGTLDIGGLSLSALGAFTPQINATGAGTGYDQLIVAPSGSVDITNATLTLSGTYNAGASNDVFTLILNNSALPVIGEFAGLPNGTIFSAGSQAYQISYFDDGGTPGFELGGLGNDVSLLAVPEPGSAILLLGGVGVMLAARRRRDLH